MAFSDWNLEAAEELGYERELEKEQEAEQKRKDKEHVEQVGRDLARYMGV